MTLVDTSIANVPLDRIFFDVGGGEYVRLPNATDELILAMRDRIPPLNSPKYDGVGKITYLDSGDLVLGYTSGGFHYAYPFQVLSLHEFINDEIDGVPLLISYCPLCRSAIVFDRRIDGMTLTFGNTNALYENNAVAYDKNTGSYWFQAAGEAIVGPLTGKRLRPLPSTIATWAEWSASHPDGLVISADTGYRARYDIDYFAGYESTLENQGFAFPLSKDVADSRLAPWAHVLVVMRGDSTKAYSLDDLGDASVNDVIAGENILVLSLEAGPSGAAFVPEVDGQTLTFQRKAGHFADEVTGSTWSIGGDAIAGPLEGKSLEQLPTLFTFWFSAVVVNPGIDLYSP